MLNSMMQTTVLLSCINACFIILIFVSFRFPDEDFVDYDSDYDAKAEAGRGPAVSVDPYAGLSLPLSLCRNTATTAAS